MNTDKIIDRVRKLLELANSANEHEAANAANAAAELMERHRIDAALLAQAEQKEEVENEQFSLNEDIRSKRKFVTVPRWYWVLAFSIGMANRTRPNVRMTGRHKGYVTFVGKPSDAMMARYMLDKISDEVNRLGKKFAKQFGTGVGGRAGQSFRLGCAETIADRLHELKERVMKQVEGEVKDCTALVRVANQLALKDRELTVFAARHGVFYVKTRRTTISSTEAYKHGRERGKTIDIGHHGPRKALTAGQ